MKKYIYLQSCKLVTTSFFPDNTVWFGSCTSELKTRVNSHLIDKDRYCEQTPARDTVSRHMLGHCEQTPPEALRADIRPHVALLSWCLSISTVLERKKKGFSFV